MTEGRVLRVFTGPVVVAFAVTGVVVASWEFLAAPGADFLPKPSEIVRVLVDRWSSLFGATVETGREALIGFVIGCSIAIVLAFIALLSPAVEAAMLRMALALYAVPVIVVAPLFALWLGPGLKPKIALSALAVFFGVLVNTIRGMRSASRESRELFHVFAASGFQTLRYVRLPFALPYMMNAFKVAAPAAVFGAIVGEWVGADRGLGVTLIVALFQFQVALLWAAMFLTTAIALGAYGLIALSERFLIPWHESVRTSRLEG